MNSSRIASVEETRGSHVKLDRIEHWTLVFISIQFFRFACVACVVLERNGRSRFSFYFLGVVVQAVCQSKRSWEARHTGMKIVQQISILMGCAVSVVCVVSVYGCGCGCGGNVEGVGCFRYILN